MARYLIVADKLIVGDVEAKTMKAAVLSLGRVGTYRLFRVESEETLTLREVVQMAVEVEEEGGEEE